jgi:hypothetical protein
VLEVKRVSPPCNKQCVDKVSAGEWVKEMPPNDLYNKICSNVNRVLHCSTALPVDVSHIKMVRCERCAHEKDRDDDLCLLKRESTTHLRLLSTTRLP